MSLVTTARIVSTLKRTLEGIITDGEYGESKLLHKMWAEQHTMTDNFEDYVEFGGPGLASTKAEGAEISTATIHEGALTRFLTDTFALKLIVTQETIEDEKYKEVVNAAKRLVRAMYKTQDIDMTQIWVRMFNAAYVGGDNKPLAAADHPLPHGGVESNLMPTPISASRVGLEVATTNIRKMRGHDGIIEGYEPMKIICPQEQEWAWKTVLQSEKAPEQGEFNAINTVRDMGIKALPNRYWNNTESNWAIITDAENGPQIRHRVKPMSETWKDNDHTQMKYSVRARWARGWADWRSVYGVAA